jgi:xanthine dehydrogenase accessory factor
VIVSRTASPDLVMGMSKACAMATEYGGQGATASGFARQYGIPAVVGVAGLFEAISNGDLLRVDGTKGTVEIVELDGCLRFKKNIDSSHEKGVDGVKDLSVVIKGAGEMASGIAHRLYMANITRICMTEIERPLAVRRGVSFCEALFTGQTEVEGVIGKLIRNEVDLARAWDHKEIGIIIDPAWKIVSDLKPDVVVDAIMAKRNLGTGKDEAPLVIGVGPGFSAPRMVHVVVESNRGHNLGRAIYDGAAEPHTGMPGLTAGFSRERVLRSPHGGIVRHVKSIGDTVAARDTILFIDNTPVRAAIDGIVRGLIREIEVGENEKVGDIEPRGDISCCWTISDKARAIAGGVLEAIMHHLNA